MKRLLLIILIFVAFKSNAQQLRYDSIQYFIDVVGLSREEFEYKYYGSNIMMTDDQIDQDSLGNPIYNNVYYMDTVDTRNDYRSFGIQTNLEGYIIYFHFDIETPHIDYTKLNKDKDNIKRISLYLDQLVALEYYSQLRTKEVFIMKTDKYVAIFKNSEYTNTVYFIIGYNHEYLLKLFRKEVKY